jgi:hypothetical protein
MGEFETTSTAADLEALEALQADASELERIEELLDQFNVFEAIGFVHLEVMHSRSLAFLLDPRQNYGLGDLFLRSFLRKCSESADENSLSKGDHIDRDLNQTTVHTDVHTGDGKYEDNVSASEREQEIRRQWSQFLAEDLPSIEEVVRKEKWIWEPVETDSV